jgi:inorganic pyrophosphatase
MIRHADAKSFNNQAEIRSKVKVIFELYVGIGNGADSNEIHETINLIHGEHYHVKVIGILQGFWEENPQDTLLVQVSDTEKALQQTIEKLKDYLDTDAVWAQNIQDTFK